MGLGEIFLGCNCPRTFVSALSSFVKISNVNIIVSLQAKTYWKLEIKTADMANDITTVCLILQNSYFKALKTNTYSISGKKVFKSIQLN